ncbi:hypothetical protein ES703_102145 [subsurface metagenome]
MCRIVCYNPEIDKQPKPNFKQSELLQRNVLIALLDLNSTTIFGPRQGKSSADPKNILHVAPRWTTSKIGIPRYLFPAERSRLEGPDRSTSKPDESPTPPGGDPPGSQGESPGPGPTRTWSDPPGKTDLGCRPPGRILNGQYDVRYFPGFYLTWMVTKRVQNEYKVSTKPAHRDCSGAFLGLLLNHLCISLLGMGSPAP